MTTFEDIINQSFIEDQNKYNNRQIDNSEKNNVNNLFNEVQLINIDCNICYTEDNCIQCYQCHFKYCKDCLTKVISEFKKCSACNVDYKNNYQALKNKNKKDTPQKIRNNTSNNLSANSNSTNTNTNTINNRNKNSNNLYNEYFEKNIENYVFDEDIIIDEDIVIDDDIIIDNDNTIYYNNYNQSNSVINRQENDNKNSYLNELMNNEILPFEFKTFKDNCKYSFSVRYDRENHLQIYTSTKETLSPIILNYKILDTYFQSSLRIYLIHLLESPNKFKPVWNKISLQINNFCNNYTNINIKNNTEFEFSKRNLIDEIKKLVGA